MATQTIYGSFQGSNAGNYQIKCECSSTSNETNNYSNVTVSLYMRRTGNVEGQWNLSDSTSRIVIDGTDSGYSVTPFDTRSTTSWILLKTYTKNNIYHNSDGKKTINISANFNPNATSSLYGGAVSGSFKLDDIPRQAVITSAPDFNDEQNPTINYKNQAGDIVTSLQACISLSGSADDIPYRDIPKNGTSYTFNLTEAERNTLRNATTTSNSRTVIFFIRTVINGNTLNSTLSKTLSIVNAKPVFTTANVTYEDTNSSVVAITKNNQHIVQNKSNVKVNYTSATALKGASISNYSFNLNGVTQGVTGSSGAVIFGAINSSSNLTLTATVTDSRGNKTSVTKTVTVIPYSVPTALVTLNRLNNYEDTTYLTVDGSIASVNNKNVMTIKYRSKVKDGTYGSFTTINDNEKQTLTFDKNTEYVINVVVSDSFNEKFDKEFPLSKGVFPLYIDTEKNSVAINCLSSRDKAFEIEGDVVINGKDLINLIYPVGSIYISTNNLSPQDFFGGTWEAFATGRTLVGIDTSQTEFNSVGKTGGAKAHTLTVAQMPQHEGHMYDNFNDTGWVDRGGDTNSYYLNSTGTAGYGKYENRPYKVVSGNEIVMQGFTRGGNEAHNNLQPYVVVYMWKRIS